MEPNIVAALIGAGATILVFLMGVGATLSLQSRSEKKLKREDDALFGLQAELALLKQQAGGDAISVDIGSELHKLAERAVAKGILERAPGPVGYYSLPGTFSGNHQHYYSNWS